MENSIGVVIGRPVNGISLNGLEYALDENQEYLHFDSVEDAKQFLRDNGVEEDDELDDCFVYQYHTFCLNCGREYFLDPSETFVDKLGRGYYCNECDHSFDVI